MVKEVDPIPYLASLLSSEASFSTRRMKETLLLHVSMLRNRIRQKKGELFQIIDQRDLDTGFVLNDSNGRFLPEYRSADDPGRDNIDRGLVNRFRYRMKKAIRKRCENINVEHWAEWLDSKPRDNCEEVR